MDKIFDFKNEEARIYELWEKSGYFNPDNLLGEHKKTFTIAVPPPNVTGSLHMGHALQATMMDILIRRKRMAGFKTLWIAGTDHAGIATQNVVEKELKKQGISRQELGREKFLEKVWEWKEKYGDIILKQFKKLGASMDWSRVRFTMDAEYVKAVEAAFKHYYNKGWIYKGERVINWCTRCQTSLSDLELEYKEEKGKLWFIKYPLVHGTRNMEHGTDKDYITVATTRPETMLGDMAVAVNSKDERYKNYIGKNVLLPIQEREIPIIADHRIDMNFGTGAVKVTPNHDIADEAIAIDHKLPFMQIINEQGRMTDASGKEFAGLKVMEAREKVVMKLQELGLIEKIEDYTHNVAICSRCTSVIEPLRSKQWFLKIDELAKLAIKDVKEGKIKFHPERWQKLYFDWLSNIHDWCISRQIWWGHKIPMEGENDVLDTWFSSALWPFATLGWPEKTKDLETFYPTQVLTTARDIINLWVARMIFSSEEFMGTIPFSDVVIHATILTKDGKRMSKSKGTGIDPMTLIEQYGADATRFGLIWQAMGGQDIHWDESAVVAGKKFVTKLWNIARFVLAKTENIASEQVIENKLENPEDIAIIAKLNQTKQAINISMEEYEFGQALHTLYDFIWHDFADKYIEAAKQRTDQDAQKVLHQVLREIMKILHPFMPFVTEAIWEKMPNREDFLIAEN